MSRPANPISATQFIFLITGLQSGVVFLTLPRNLASIAGTDSWLAIPAGWLISSAVGIVIVRIMQYCPDGNLLDLLQSRIGPWAARTAAVLFAGYFFVFAYDGFILSVLVTKVWLLPNTSVFVLAALFLLPSMFIAKYGLQTISRYAVAVILMSLWIPIVYLITLKDAEWLYLLPLLKEGGGPVLSAVYSMVYPALGMVAAFFLYPHLIQKKAATAYIVVANTLSHSLYLFITLVCFVYFSPDELAQLNNPVITIMNSLEFNFIERVEVPFIAFYVLIFSLDLIPSIYLVSYCLQRVGKKGSIRLNLVFVAAAIIVTMLIRTPSMLHVDDLNKMLGTYGFAIEYVLPVGLLVYLAMRSRRTKA